MPTKPGIETTRCASCGKGEIRVRRMTRSYGRGATLLIVENVPVLVCAHCGESYLTADTLHLLERIKVHRRSLAAPRRVAVAKFTHSSVPGMRGLAKRRSRRRPSKERTAAQR